MLPKSRPEMDDTPYRQSTSGFGYIKEDDEDITYIKKLRSGLRRELRGLWIDTSSYQEVDSTTDTVVDEAEFIRKPTEDDDDDDDDDDKEIKGDDGDGGASNMGHEDHLSLRMHLAHRLRK